MIEYVASCCIAGAIGMTVLAAAFAVNASAAAQGGDPIKIRIQSGADLVRSRPDGKQALLWRQDLAGGN